MIMQVWVEKTSGDATERENRDRNPFPSRLEIAGWLVAHNSVETNSAVYKYITMCGSLLNPSCQGSSLGREEWEQITGEKA